MTLGPRMLVFHAGALGDHVLLWPLLRTLARDGHRVALVSDAAKARLAARAIGVEPIDVEQPRWRRLWIPSAAPSPRPAGEPDTTVIYSTLHAPDDPGFAAWAAAARAATGATHVHAIGPPGSPSREALWARLQIPLRGIVAPRSNLAGPIVLHAGAGSPVKRWPLDNLIALSERLASAGRPTHLIAGEVEAERFSTDDRQAFAAAGGELLSTLEELYERLNAAAGFVGADTGPTHLSAQLGLPTVALFGPTDPAIWAPIGPGVRVIAPDVPQPMSWLAVPLVCSTLETLLEPPSSG